MDAEDAGPDAAAGADGSAELAQQHALRALVEKTSNAFIPVSHATHAASFDPSYLAERASHYAHTMRVADGPPVGSTISLKPPPASPPPASAVEAALGRVLDVPPADPRALELARSTAAALGEAMAGLAVQGKHEVSVSVG